MVRRVLIPVLAALVAAGAGAAAGGAGEASGEATARAEAAARAPKVRQLVVFRDGTAVQRRVGAGRTRVRVRGRRCAIGAGTALAALARSRVGRLRFKDFGACSSRPGAAAGLLVTGIGPDRNRGQRGWVYKVGSRAATAGAGDTGGPFGRGRLRRGQRVTWFYCVRAADCQRTLAMRIRAKAGGIAVTVRGYDDVGDAVPVEGASVSTSDGATGETGADGSVRVALAPGTHRVVARKDGLVRSFTERVEVP